MVNTKTKKKNSKKIPKNANFWTKFSKKANKKHILNAKNKKTPQNSPSFLSQLLMTMMIFTLLLAVYGSVVESFKKKEVISLSELAVDVAAGQVDEISVKGEILEIKYVLEDAEVVEFTEDQATTSTSTLAVIKKSKKENEASLTETLSNYGVGASELVAVNIVIKEPTGFKYWFNTLAPLLLPLLIIIFIIGYLSKQMGRGGMQAFTFGNSRARLTDPKDKKQKVTFKDVAGAKEAKEELSEIVDFLKSPKKFLKIGARIPKGVILMGAPGTGKTLMARAVAGEAGVPFMSISGSEFVEMFVGVGASRVRDMFAQAKKSSPAIIFVDEIDAVGRMRSSGAGVGGGNDEREQTLNQILVEMDGFEPNEKVIVMAATNRPDVLDPALLRPGRFDRRVTVDLPDKEARAEVLAVHSNAVGKKGDANGVKKKPLHENVNFKVVAERTPGFSGADLANLMNEAAILAARNQHKKITQQDILNSIEKVMLGPERKSHVLNKQEKEITAYHEAGHALIASVLPHADPVHKISIISRGRAAGYTLKLPFEDKRMQTKAQFLDDIAVSLGGYVAEKQTFGDVTTGPSNDLQVLTALARNMVTRWGMSDKLGTMAFESDGGQVLFGAGVSGREYSESMSAEIDTEVRKIIDESYKRVEQLLQEHKPVLDAIANKLTKDESIEREEFEQLLKANGIQPKKKG